VHVRLTGRNLVNSVITPRGGLSVKEVG
jgi:hypothetical protein